MKLRQKNTFVSPKESDSLRDSGEHGGISTKEAGAQGAQKGKKGKTFVLDNIFMQLDAENVENKKSKKSSMSFVSTSRKKYHQTFVKPNEDD